MAVRKVIAPAANEPVVMPDGSVNPNWYLFFKFIETLNPLSDYDTSSIDAAIALKSDILRNVITVSGPSYSMGTSDTGGYFRFTSGSAVTVTIPTNATSPIAVKSQMDGVQAGNGKVTFAPAVGVTFNSFATYKSLAGKMAPFSLVKVDTDEWDLVGNLIA